MRLMGVTAAPWKVRATAISRVNNPVDTIMLDDDVPRVLRLAKEVQEGHGSIQGSPKRARVASLVPTDPGPESVQPPVESRRSGRVRRVSVRLNDFVH